MQSAVLAGRARKVNDARRYWYYLAMRPLVLDRAGSSATLVIPFLRLRESATDPSSRGGGTSEGF